MYCLIFQMVVAFLAAGAVVDVLNNGSLFESKRQEWETLRDSDYISDRRRLLYELLTCPYCLSFHVPWIVLGFLRFCGDFHVLSWNLPDGIASSLHAVMSVVLSAVYLLIHGLAITRVVTVTDGLLPAHLRFSRKHKDEIHVPRDTEDRETSEPSS